MADINQNQNMAGASDDSAKKKFDSPWDEELPPEDPKAAKIVGSLDAKPSDAAFPSGDKKPVPFNIPTNVSDEKVGKKIPAEAVIAQSNTLQPDKPEILNNQPAKNLSQNSAKADSINPVKPAEPKLAVAQPVKPIIKPEPVENKVTNTPIVAPIKKTITPAQTVSEPPKPNKPETGVEELIKPRPKVEPLKQNEIKPALEGKNNPIMPANPINQPVKPAPTIAPIKTETLTKPPTPSTPILPAPVPPAPVAESPIPVMATPSVAPAEKVPIYPTPIAKLEPESEAMADIRPASKVEEEIAPPILPNISRPIRLENEEVTPPPISRSNPVNPIKNIKEERKAPPPEIRKPVANDNPPFYKKLKFLIPAIVIFLFVLGVYLTEAGILGFGLEKVYGLTGVESLWGGLPRNPEKALGISAQTMQKQLNFKIKGSISMTVNKTIKSPVTSPLVSSINLPFVFRDTNNAAGMSAITTQYDYYGDNTSTTTDTSTSTTSTDSSTTTDTTTPTDTTSTDTTSTDTASILGDQTNQDVYTPEESTIKQIDSDIIGESSDQAIKTDLVLKKLVGSSSTVSLVSTKNQLFVKSSQDIKFATNAEQSKWLEFNLSSIENENPFKDFTNIKLDQGFSIIGRRSGNEKVGSVRCYKYTIDNLEIGDSLDFLGIKKDSVQKIEGNLWIGVSDHYLHKIDLKIIPSISSSISQMSLTLEMYDFGIENSIQIPTLADKIVANVDVSSTSTTTTTTTTETTNAPSVASAVTMAERDQTRKQDLQNIKSALDKYKTANGKFPVASSMIHLDAKDNIVQKALIAEYMTSVPTDPMAGDGWYYGYKSNGKTFTLSARLENTADPQVTRVGDIYLHWVYNN